MEYTETFKARMVRRMLGPKAVTASALGLHREQLDAWRGTVTTALEQPAGAGGGRRTAAETMRIKELERELRRKEKALAETAALLVLRKKVEALWGAADDDTDGKNES